MISIAFDFSKIAAKLDIITKAAEQGVRPAAQAGAIHCHNSFTAAVSLCISRHFCENGG